MLAARAEAAAEAIRTQGCVLLRGLLDAREVADLCAAVDGALAESAVPFGTNEFLGLRTRRLFNLLARDARFEQLPVHAGLLPVIERALDRECLLSSLTAIEMHPGQVRQPLHADDGTLPLARPHPPYTCTAIVALTDFTPENGATHYVPGSHGRERRPRPGEVAETRQAVMPAGSAFVYHGSLWHGGGANRSASRRLAIVVNYCAGFLRQEESQLLALPRERVARMAPRLRALVGYSTYRGLLGHVDQRDPAALLDPTVPTEMVWERMRGPS